MKNILIILLSLLSIGCMTYSNSTLTPDANLQKYHKITIDELKDYEGSDPRFSYVEVELYNLFNQAGLKTLGNKKAESLSPEEREDLLLAKYTVAANIDNASVSITFYDYETESLLGNCTTSFDLAIGVKANTNGALFRMEKLLQEIFSVE